MPFDGVKAPALLIVATTAATIRGFLLPFAEHFRKRGWRVDGMAAEMRSYPQCADSFDRVWEVKWSRNPMDLSNLLEAPRTIRRVIEQESYDLVHVHTPVAAFVTRYTLRNRPPAGPKVIYTAHGFHFCPGGSRVRNSIFLTLEKLAGRWTDYLVVINKHDEAAAHRHKLVSPGRVQYMPGIGVDTRTLSPHLIPESDVRAVRQELGLSAQSRLFLMIGRLASGKRHGDCIRAFANLDERLAHLAFAGTGPLSERLKTLADELGVRKRVHFLGYRSDIPALIRASTATLMTSEREGLSRSVMESLSLGIPVIGSDARGVTDLISDECGIIAPLGDITALTRAMQWMGDHPEEAKRMGMKGRDKMSYHDLDHIIALHEDLYSSALNGEGHIVAGSIPGAHAAPRSVVE